VQEDLYTPVVGQVGTVGSITVLGHVYMAGYVGTGYGLEEDGVSIASITGKRLMSHRNLRSHPLIATNRWTWPGAAL
jgi:hypothetical protein